MPRRRVKNVNIEDAKIIFRNFSGEASRFNAAGKRNFCVILSEQLAEELISEGWNVKRGKPRDPDDTPDPYLQVAVSYESYPPDIYMITGKNKILLNEESVGTLDSAEIKYVDLVIRPYVWEVNNQTGVKAYVKSMYVTIEEDVFAHKYNFDTIDDEDTPF